MFVGQVLANCVEQFVSSRGSLLDEIKHRAIFELSRGSTDVERMQFESDRLQLELTQIVHQLTSIHSEFTQVEDKIKAMTAVDQQERQEALKAKV